MKYDVRCMKFELKNTKIRKDETRNVHDYILLPISYFLSPIST